MSEPKPPSAYLHGEGPEAVVIVPVRIAAWLATRTNLSAIRISARGTDPEVYAVLAALHRGGLQWQTQATGSAQRKEPEVPAPSKWVSTSKAADLLGITDRAVRLAIEEERLPAERHGRNWRIARTDIEQYRAARRAA
ncbi:helix-turn-helix domain-containing protein [Cellulosimicrobium funkei]|nr:helix-turn-helix domain-containing protein [Cellulosimicrobium funkei]